MNVVDSSAWLEYFTAGANAHFFAEAIENTQELLIPSLSLHEVFKRVVQQRTENDGLHSVAVMQQGRVVDLDARISLVAARISIDLQLPLADSVMLWQRPRSYEATFWTQDSHFIGIPGIRYKKASS